MDRNGDQGAKYTPEEVDSLTLRANNLLDELSEIMGQLTDRLVRSQHSEEGDSNERGRD